MAIIKLKKDKNAQHFELSAVQDVKVNGTSVFDGEEANIKLKTINNQSIVGEGNIDIEGGGGEYVKYSPNQNLTDQQKTDARNNIDALNTKLGIDNANKNLVTDAQGNVTTSDYALGQIIVDYFEELPINVPVTAKASVINSSNYYVPLVQNDLSDYVTNQIIMTVKAFETPDLTNLNDGNFVAFDNGNYAEIGYSSNFTTNEAIFYLGYQTETEEIKFIYSAINQMYADEEQEIKVGWNKLVIDFDLGTEVVTQIDYSEVENIVDAKITLFNSNQYLLNCFGQQLIHLAGNYIYTEVQPSTTPKTYYWRYDPTNVQSDNNEDDSTSLAYIKNRAKLNTTNTTAQSVSNNELIKGTINLHKIAKTGKNEDLIGKVGITNINNNATRFNDFVSNIASGTNSSAFGYHTQATGAEAMTIGYYTKAGGMGALATGIETDARESGSFTTGLGTVARVAQQFVSGRYNLLDYQTSYANIIGNGTDNNNRANIQTIDWNGNLWVKGNVRVGGTSWGTGNLIGITYEFEAEYELGTIYIPAENLNYIRQELPEHIIVHLLSDGDETDVIIFTLADADDIKISYLNILQSSSRTLRYSFLTINSTDTEITGSEISTSNYISIPTPPQNNKTYILKSTGGIINWVEET